MINKNDKLQTTPYTDSGSDKIKGMKLKPGLYMTETSNMGRKERYFWKVKNYTKTSVTIAFDSKKFNKKIYDDEFSHWNLRHDILNIQVTDTNTTRMSLEWLENNIGVCGEEIIQQIPLKGFHKSMKNPKSWNGEFYLFI